MCEPDLVQIQTNSRVTQFVSFLQRLSHFSSASPHLSHFCSDLTLSDNTPVAPLSVIHHTSMLIIRLPVCTVPLSTSMSSLSPSSSLHYCISISSPAHLSQTADSHLCRHECGPCCNRLHREPGRRYSSTNKESRNRHERTPHFCDATPTPCRWKHRRTPPQQPRNKILPMEASASWTEDAPQSLLLLSPASFAPEPSLLSHFRVPSLSPLTPSSSSVSSSPLFLSRSPTTNESPESPNLDVPASLPLFLVELATVADSSSLSMVCENHGLSITSSIIEVPSTLFPLNELAVAATMVSENEEAGRIWEGTASGATSGVDGLVNPPLSPYLKSGDEIERKEEAESTIFASSMTISGIKLDESTRAAIRRVRIAHKRHTSLSGSGQERLAPGTQQAAIGITNGEATEQMLIDVMYTLMYHSNIPPHAWLHRRVRDDTGGRDKQFFLDVGSGYGLPVMRARVLSGAQICGGVEVVAERCEISHRIAADVSMKAQVLFATGDVCNPALRPILLAATHIFAFSAVFHPDTRAYLASALSGDDSSWQVYVTCDKPQVMQKAGLVVHTSLHTDGCCLGGAHLLGSKSLKMVSSKENKMAYYLLRCKQPDAQLRQKAWEMGIPLLTQQSAQSAQTGEQVYQAMLKECTVQTRAQRKRVQR
jgi:hypothetical protein